ncbi:hypothetical protein CARUB_v100220761mg, partial [Capsella rubella]
FTHLHTTHTFTNLRLLLTTRLLNRLLKRSLTTIQKKTKNRLVI